MQPGPPARSVTKTVTIDRSAAEVHAFLADATNWPRWAIVNVLAVEPGDDPLWWRITTPDGFADFRLRADAATGVVDHDFRDESMEVATVPARVVGNGRGADFMMTVTQPPEVDDSFFEGLMRSVETELAALKEILEVPHTTCHMSISLDGFVAGPDQSLENPLGMRGQELHGWHIGDPRANEADKVASKWLMRPRGAYVMGRNMFGPIRGDWDQEWTGWWGPEPPYHAPVFVLTHHRHDPIPMDGGTTFHFVTEGFDAAYAAACEAAGESGVDIAGGASTVRQALNAGVIDELTLDIAPVLLGSGERIFDGVESFGFEPAEVLHSPLTTHIRYRRVS